MTDDTSDTDQIVDTVQRIAPVFGGINLEDAEQKASADYQERMEEFDSVESSTPITTVPNTGESGTVEMPKS